MAEPCGPVCTQSAGPIRGAWFGAVALHSRRARVWTLRPGLADARSRSVVKARGHAARGTPDASFPPQGGCLSELASAWAVALLETLLVV